MDENEKLIPDELPTKVGHYRSKHNVFSFCMYFYRFCVFGGSNAGGKTSYTGRRFKNLSQIL